MADEAGARETGSEGPLVSVIIPAFNAEASLEATLSSVASQTWRKLEIVIVDDGSTDRTAEIAAAFCARDPRGVLLHKANGGVASARNHGLAHASGEWVAPVDADDLWHPTKIARQVAAALAAPERPGLVYCWFRTIDAEGRVTGSGEAHAVDGPALRRLAYRNFVGNGSGPLIVREAAIAAGGYDEGLQRDGAQGCEDALIQLRLARTHALACVPEYLVGYRNTPGAMSGNQERMFRSWGLALGRFREEGGGVPERVLGWNMGRRCLTLAESRAIRRDWAGTAGMLARAAWLDPGRTGRVLAYRTARFLRRKLGRARPASERPLFLDCDPRAPISGDRNEIAGWAARLDSFERRRMERLAEGESGLE
jgi:glycosyltransferase involved in cell wall biosynthesis